MDTLHKILKLISNKGIDQQDFAIQLGLHKRTITDWKSGKSKSYMKYIDRIADYFNVSTDYLLGKSDVSTIKKIELTLEEQAVKKLQDQLLSLYMELDADGQNKLREQAELLALKHKK